MMDVKMVMNKSMMPPRSVQATYFAAGLLACKVLSAPATDAALLLPTLA